jgi:predicted Zn-dependent peptidase
VILEEVHLAPQGLAHYLEHMLFMGSEKYPGEGIQWRADNSWFVNVGRFKHGKLPVK